MSSAGDGRPENPELVSREDMADSCTVVSDGEGDMQWLEATCLLVSKVQAVRHWVCFLVFKVWFLNAKFLFLSTRQEGCGFDSQAFLRGVCVFIRPHPKGLRPTGNTKLPVMV